MPDWVFLSIETLVGTYAIFTLALCLLWMKVPRSTPAVSTLSTKVSVIIPVRNEAGHIGPLLADLNRQTYPSDLFEVLVVDDASSDQTADIVRNSIKSSSIIIKLIELNWEPGTASPKKRAIEAALLHATGVLMVTTDGDCRAGPDWLTSLAGFYQATQAKLISGPVTFIPEQSLTDHLQTVEFSSLIGSGAAAIAAGSPSLCNGANLAYEKEVFREVAGFAGNGHLASGDDEFLMHKIAARYPGGVHFLKDPRALVRTIPHGTWRDFYRQRKRWASKWKHYQNPVSLVLALYIFSCNAILLVAAGLGFFQLLGWNQVLLILLTKWIPEWLFIGRVLIFLQKPKSISYIPLVQVLYPFYVTFFGMVAQKPTYVWKGRRLR